MGLRFRKSIKIAPGLKLNLNKKSIGLTAGTKGAHYTINSKGKKTASVGIPGTGLYYTESTGGKKGNKKESANNSNLSEEKVISSTESNANNSNGKKKHGCLFTFIVFAIVVTLFSSIFSSDLEDVVLSANSYVAPDLNSEVTITASTTPEDYELKESDFICSGGTIKIKDGEIVFSAATAGSYEIYVEHEDIKSNIIRIKVKDKAAILAAQKKAEEEKKKAEEEKKKAEEEAQQNASAQSQNNYSNSQSSSSSGESNAVAPPIEDMVWVSATGSKYHNIPNCGRMDPSRARQITRAQAEAQGLTPCDKCF